MQSGRPQGCSWRDMSIIDEHEMTVYPQFPLYPLITTRGRSLATLRLTPELWAASATISISL